MALYENLSEFAGLQVRDFSEQGDITDFCVVAPRLRCMYDDELTLRDFLAMLPPAPPSHEGDAPALKSTLVQPPPSSTGERRANRAG